MAAIERVTRIVANREAEAKRFATLRAQFAMHGHELHRADDGTYWAACWNWTRSLPTLRDAEEFLHKIGGAR